MSIPAYKDTFSALWLAIGMMWSTINNNSQSCETAIVPWAPF